jgi:endonuclease/exonuclease/phosphatase family metal-dependent hydrolase
MAVEKNPNTLQVLHWNVWYRADPHKIGEHLLKLTEEYGVPDVLCLQEVTSSTLSVAADVIRARSISYVETRRHKGGKGEGQAMLSPDLFANPLADTEIVMLSQGGRAPFKGGKESKRVLRVARVVAPNGQTVHVGNVHTSYRTATNGAVRQQEVASLAQLAEGREQFVLTGDFNAPGNSRMVRTLGNLMVQHRVETPTWTSCHFDLGRGLLTRTIDHVFATKDLDVHVQSLPAGPSDHTPLLVNIES